MADTKKRDPYVEVLLPQGVVADAYIDRPDDRAPEGAAFQPDGKYKVKIVYEDESPLSAVEEKIKKAATAKWSDVDFEDFKFPWTSHDDDVKREGFRGKTVVSAKTKNKLSGDKLVDAKRKPLPADVKVFGGDIIKAIASLYLYEKVEAVKVGKKIEQVKMRGCSLQLAAVQLIQKRAMGGGDVSFGEEDGYEAPASFASAPVSDDGSDGDF